eukprot:COSAG01_NODE_657_length_14457_cov_99.379649_17_plen_60_part_00
MRRSQDSVGWVDRRIKTCSFLMDMPLAGSTGQGSKYCIYWGRNLLLAPSWMFTDFNDTV